MLTKLCHYFFPFLYNSQLQSQTVHFPFQLRRALWLRKSRDLWTLRLAKGELGPVPTPEDADAYPYSAADRMMIEANRPRSIVGTPDQVKARLEELAAAFGVDEVVVVTICHEFEARVRSYELLAESQGILGDIRGYNSVGHPNAGGPFSSSGRSLEDGLPIGDRMEDPRQAS